jgi:hypothetical protein
MNYQNIYTNIPKRETTVVITKKLKMNSGINENSQNKINNTHTRNSTGTKFFSV